MPDPPSGDEWHFGYLPMVRGAIDLLDQRRGALRARYAALGEAGPALMHERIALLDRQIVRLSALMAVLRRARNRLVGLVDRPEDSLLARSIRLQGRGYRAASIAAERREVGR